MGPLSRRTKKMVHCRIYGVVLVLLVWMCVHVSSAFCPKKCTCSSNEIVCRRIGLTAMPFDLLSLNDSSLLQNYTKIDFSQNRIKVIPEGFIQKFPNLKEMRLGNNEFLDIPFDALQSLPSLIFLGLERNIIRGLGESNLAFLKRLKEINLSSNLISKITDQSLKGLSSLEILKLEYNQIRSISANAFRPTPKIRELSLGSNELELMPRAISTLTALQDLQLGRNRIVHIPNGLFQSCRDLRILDLGGNAIEEIDNDAFRDIPKLEELIIAEARGVSEFPNFNGTISLELLKLDRAQIETIPRNLCEFCPKLKSLELKSNKIREIPTLRQCKKLRVLDLAHNEIRHLNPSSTGESLFSGLVLMHDVLLNHNNITDLKENAFKGMVNLKVLDLSNNRIKKVHNRAFVGLDELEDINLGVNEFDKFPTEGLKNVLHLKTHNIPNLQDFPGAQRFPRIQSLVLSYAYHCCQFLPSTYENIIPDYSDFGGLQETVFFPGEGNFDHALWHSNNSDIWSNNGVQDPNDLWSDFNPEAYDNLIVATPPPGIQCSPTPGPFLPCNDLFDWWTLRCSVWIVFLLALLGNGCVVIVLIASRSKMDVPRFLVCNLAMADFSMGLYLGFLAVVDASTLGEFRKYALPWQFSTACQAAGFFGVLSSELSVFTLAVITLERNYAITHAMHLNKRLSLKHASYIMACGWSFALIMATLPLLGISDYRKFAVCLPFDIEDGLSLGYVIFLLLINGVAFSILMGCYLKMYCAIRGSQAWNSNDSRIAKRMALLVFTDFLCWFPIAFLSLFSCFGLHLISLEQAKVFTIFILPLNSCCNPFLYAILTKQFKKDCVMICKAIEESRVTRGIGRCRHSSNFSNRQTPANTNSLNSGSGGSHGSHSRGTVCSCNGKKNKKGAAVLATKWPFNKIKHMFHGCKETAPIIPTQNESYTQQIAQIQHKSNRHPSVSSDNFSSSRSDSWRNHGQCIPGLRFGGPSRYRQHRRRNSWTVTRKPSQDSQMSSSRNDSGSSNSTNTWRMSRSSVSSEMSNSLARTGSSKTDTSSTSGPGVLNGPGALNGTGKFSALAQRTQARAAAAATAAAVPGLMGSGLLPGGPLHANGGIMKPPHLARLSSDSSSLSSSKGGFGKPRLTRQTAILADADSTSSAKSVTFQEPPGRPHGGGRGCPVHTAEYVAALNGHYRSLYNKLMESHPEDEESDMEASDAEIDDEAHSDSMPLGTTYLTLRQHLQPVQNQAEIVASLTPVPRLPATGRLAAGFVPRKLTVIHEEDEEDEDEDEEAEKKSLLPTANNQPQVHSTSSANTTAESEDGNGIAKSPEPRQPSANTNPSIAAVTGTKSKKPYLNTDV
ncbi:hypothetical protein TCAL_02569 [Tigriopus californicus]|uniref:G-protein coupled receptors family 1 profile domain-containing protein n=1 Tax=Tigriopus californicus TaxID=6832 RepID=A0A553P6D6_TIGCA|nr:hypothetical protein TCAL_02569 [Tigriopus californicus]